MSVQRWLLFNDASGTNRMGTHDRGEYVTYADHARIVAEAEDATAERCRWAYEQGKADAEQAHAAALAEQWDKAYLAGASHAAGLAAAARTLTADDAEPGVGSVVLDPDGDAWQRVGDPGGQTYWYSTFGWRGDWTAVPLPAALIHDSGKPPLDECACGHTTVNHYPAGPRLCSLCPCSGYHDSGKEGR